MATTPRINNTNLLKTSGLRIFHINRIEDGDRSTTIAYRSQHGSIVEFSTAVTNPLDRFCRKVGTKTAIESFQAGRVVRVPVPRDWQGHVQHFVQTLFGGMI